MKSELLREKCDAFNIKRSKITALMTLAISLLTIFACVVSLSEESIYRDLLSAGTMTNYLLAGSQAQDIIFIPLALILGFLSITFLKRPNYKVFISMLGLTGNCLYGYGLYAMQGQYTVIYLIYLAIFGLSIYSMVLGLLSFKSGFLATTLLPKAIRISTSIFLYFIVIMLGVIWIIRITPDIARHIPQETYGVFVLDLCIVFPAIAITATKLIGNKPIGNLLAGVILTKAFTVCLSWGFGEWYLRLNNYIEGDYDMLAIPTVLTIVSFAFLVLYLLKLKTNTPDLSITPK